MKTITKTINLYQYDELGEEAKRAVLEAKRAMIATGQNEIDEDSFMETLESLEAVLHIKVKRWRVDTYFYDYSFEFTSSRWDDISQERGFLVRYLNDVEGAFRKGKTYYGSWIKERAEYKRRESKVLSDYKISWSDSFPRGLYVVTDSLTEDAIREAWASRWDAVREGHTIRGFVVTILNHLFRAWRDNMAANWQDEVILDVLLDLVESDYFLEDGTEYSDR